MKSRTCVYGIQAVCQDVRVSECVCVMSSWAQFISQSSSCRLSPVQNLHVSIWTYSVTFRRNVWFLEKRWMFVWWGILSLCAWHVLYKTHTMVLILTVKLKMIKMISEPTRCLEYFCLNWISDNTTYRKGEKTLQ